MVQLIIDPGLILSIFINEQWQSTENCTIYILMNEYVDAL